MKCTLTAICSVQLVFLFLLVLSSSYLAIFTISAQTDETTVGDGDFISEIESESKMNIVSSGSITNSNFDISGVYLSNEDSIYHIKQINDTIWWVGTADDDPNVLSNIFSGSILENGSIYGKWIDYPLSSNASSGNAYFNLSIHSDQNMTLTKTSTDNDENVYPVNSLTKHDPESQRPMMFYISLDNVVIDEARSPMSDVLYVGIGAQKNDDQPLVSTKYLGIRSDGSNITSNMRIGPFIFDGSNDKNDDSIKIELLGLNKGGSRTPFTLVTLRDAIIQLMDPLYRISSLNQATNLLHSISPGLIPGGCNGLVFADEIIYTFETLKNLTSVDGKYSEEKIYSGTNSPPGCGPLSEYLIKLSITS